MVIIIGAAGGLGAGLVERLTAEPPHPGESVLPVTRRDVELEDSDSIRAFFETVAHGIPETEPVHVVNAAGVSINGFLHKLTDEAWDKTLRVNVTANLHLLQGLRTLLAGRTDGSLLVFGSVVARLGVPGTIAYATAKSALHGFTRTAAKELARVGGRVNCLDLGYFDAGMIEQVPEAALQQLVATVPLQRLGTSEDLAEACRFACRCRFLTGSIVNLNGGLS